MLLMGGQHAEKVAVGDSKESEKMALVPLNGSVGLSEEELTLIGGMNADIPSSMQAFGVNITKNDDGGDVK